MTVSVSQLNKYIFFRFKEDEQLKRLSIKGEISNFTRNLRSGHCYFTLKDAQSSIRAVMFAGYAAELDFVPAAGMNVTVTADVTVYERDGVYQLMVTAMSPGGAGALSAAFEQLRDKLEREGLFDDAHKHPIPSLPRKIGAVTSPTGAAIRDIINILSRRYPAGELAVFPASVQGDSAPLSLCAALEQAARAECDVIIIGRGGGSAEDLSAFNAECVVRAVYHSPVPVISAVGHETDFTLCDFAADLRAPTPSAAAELAAPDISGMLAALEEALSGMQNAALALCAHSETQLLNLSQRLDYLSPLQRVQRAEERLGNLSRALLQAAESCFFASEERLARNTALLESLNPLRVLARGYSAVYRGGKIMPSVRGIKDGDVLDIRLSDGKIRATVDFVEEL